MTILDNVKQLCEENGITINGLEKAGVVTRGSLAKWDKTSPGIDKVVSVARYFRVSIDRLLVGTKYEKPADLMADGLYEKNVELMKLFSSLSENQKDTVLAQLRGLAQLQKTPGDPSISE